MRNESIDISREKEKLQTRSQFGYSLLPAVGGILFVAATDRGKLEQNFLALLMLAATSLPVTSSTAKMLSAAGYDNAPINLLKDNAPKIAFAASFSMLGAVACLAVGAINTAEMNASTNVGAAAVSLFVLHSLSALAYSGGVLNGDKGVISEHSKAGKILSLFAASTGFVGSVGFLAAQVLAYNEAKASGNEQAQKAALFLGAGAVFFIAGMLNGTVHGARALFSGPDSSPSLAESSDDTVSHASVNVEPGSDVTQSLLTESQRFFSAQDASVDRSAEDVDKDEREENTSVSTIKK